MDGLGHGIGQWLFGLGKRKEPAVTLTPGAVVAAVLSGSRSTEGCLRAGFLGGVVWVWAGPSLGTEAGLGVGRALAMQPGGNIGTVARGGAVGKILEVRRGRRRSLEDSESCKDRPPRVPPRSSFSVGFRLRVTSAVSPFSSSSDPLLLVALALAFTASPVLSSLCTLVSAASASAHSPSCGGGGGRRGGGGRGVGGLHLA